MASYKIKTIEDLYRIVNKNNVGRLSEDIVNLLKVFAECKETDGNNVNSPDFSFTWIDDGAVYTEIKDHSGNSVLFTPNNDGLHIRAKVNYDIINFDI
jgi:hypothetical protein